MKRNTSCALLIAPVLLLATPVYAASWFACGSLQQIGWSCQLSGYPSIHYEYGIAYNTSAPLPVTCSYWNYGMRIYNQIPYLIESDNPRANSRWGGFMFYMGTLSTDDDYCTGGTWRHQYWRLDQNNLVPVVWSNGCYGDNMTLFCRAR